MPDDTKGELIKAGVEVVKTAYDDAAKPVAKEIGRALGTVGEGRYGHIWIWSNNPFLWNFSGFELLSDSRLDKISNLLRSPNQSASGHQRDVNRAIEALRYTRLKDEFANLLATAMDSATATLAHPAFVEILKQLTPDEAKIIERSFPWIGYMPVMDLGYTANGGQAIECRNVSELGLIAGCSNPDSTPQYIDNLCRLGIAEVSQGMLKEKAYDNIRGLPIYAETRQRVESIQSARYFIYIPGTRKKSGPTDRARIHCDCFLWEHRQYSV